MLLWGRKEEKKGGRKKEKKVVELFLNLKRYELSMLVVYWLPNIFHQLFYGYDFHGYCDGYRDNFNILYLISELKFNSGDVTYQIFR